MRSKSPFARRPKGVQKLLDEVTKIEEDFRSNRELKLVKPPNVSKQAESSDRRALQGALSKSSSELKADTDYKLKRQGQSALGKENDVAKAGKNVTPLVTENPHIQSRSPSSSPIAVGRLAEVEQIEIMYNTSKRRGRQLTPRRQLSVYKDFTVDASMGSKSTAKPKQTHRSKSPFTRWKKAEELVDDIRKKEAEASTPNTTSTRYSSSTSRSKSPFRRWKKADELVNDIRMKEKSTVLTPARSGQQSSSGNVGHAVTTRNVTRNKSPFRRWKKNNEVGDCAEEVNGRQAEYSQKAPLLPTSRGLTVKEFRVKTRHTKSPCRMNNKSFHDDNFEVVLESPTRSAIIPSLPPADPTVTARLVLENNSDMEKRKSFRNRFLKTVVDKKAKKYSEAPRPTPAADDKNARNVQDKVKSCSDNVETISSPSKASLPRAIQVKRNPVSDLSFPRLVRGRSIGEESVVQVREALGKAKDHFGSDPRSNLLVVLQTLFETTDNFNSEEDRETMKQILKRFEKSVTTNKSIAKVMGSDSISVGTSCYDRPTRRDSKDAVDKDNDDSDYLSDDDSAETSFTNWFNDDDSTDNILDLLGLSAMCTGNVDFLDENDWISEEDEEQDAFESSSSSVSSSETDDFDELKSPIRSWKNRHSSPRRMIADDEQTYNLLGDDEDMLREVEELDRKIQYEAEQAKQERIKKAKSKDESVGKAMNAVSDENSLKGILEQRRKKQIELIEMKTREVEALQKREADEKIFKVQQAKALLSQAKQTKLQEQEAMLFEVKKTKQKNYLGGRDVTASYQLDTTSSSSSETTSSSRLPKPPEQSRLANLSSFQPWKDINEDFDRYSDGEYTGATEVTDSDAFPLSPVSIGSLDSSEFDVPGKKSMEAPGYVLDGPNRRALT